MIKLFKGLEEPKKGRGEKIILLSVVASILPHRDTYFILVGFPGNSADKEFTCMQEILIQFLGWEDPGERIGYPLQFSWASLMAQMVKNPPGMQETWVQSLGWEDSPGEGTGYPLQYSGQENSMSCIVHGVAKSQT